MLHTAGDGLVPVEDEKAYSMVVHEANDSEMLRETFVHRAGHCEFTPAETIIALRTLDLRVRTGKWTGLTPAQLNNGAAALGPTYNFIYVNSTSVPTSPAFLNYQPLPFLRVYDGFTH